MLYLYKNKLNVFKTINNNLFLWLCFLLFCLLQLFKSYWPLCYIITKLKLFTKIFLLHVIHSFWKRHFPFDFLFYKKHTNFILNWARGSFSKKKYNKSHVIFLLILYCVIGYFQQSKISAIFSELSEISSKMNMMRYFCDFELNKWDFE